MMATDNFDTALGQAAEGNTLEAPAALNVRRQLIEHLPTHSSSVDVLFPQFVSIYEKHCKALFWHLVNELVLNLQIR